MIVVSKPLGGLFSVPDFGLSEVLSIQREKRAKTIQRLAGHENKDKASYIKLTLKVMKKITFRLGNISKL